MSTPLTHVSIMTAGLNELIVYGATGVLNGPVLTCSGGTSVEGQTPALQGGYNINGSDVSFSNVTCIDVEPSGWTFQLPNAQPGPVDNPDQPPLPLGGAR